MRSFTRFTTGLFTTGVLATSLLGLGSCGSYAIFKVDVTSGKTPRNDIETCMMTITDENGHDVVSNYKLDSVYGPDDSAGNKTLAQGCMGGLTNQRIGTFSYSSSRTSGALTFQVDAWNSKGSECGFKNTGGTCVPIQTGKTDAIPVKAYPPEIAIALTIK